MAASTTTTTHRNGHDCPSAMRNGALKPLHPKLAKTAPEYGTKRNSRDDTYGTGFSSQFQVLFLNFGRAVAGLEDGHGLFEIPKTRQEAQMHCSWSVSKPRHGVCLVKVSWMWKYLLYLGAWWDVDGMLSISVDKPPWRICFYFSYIYIYLFFT